MFKITKMLLCALFALFTFTSAKGTSPTPCQTPNGENATCISLNSCTPIKQALSNFDEAAVEFAKNSQCGFDGATPLVCCGSVGQITVQLASTPRPILPSAPSIPLHITNRYLPDGNTCGLQLTKHNRIVGGRVTEINEYPWMVALKYTKEEDGTPGGIRCSGTLLNHRYIMTAAQCLEIPGYKLTEVRLGEWRISTEKDCTEDTEDKEVCADPILDLVITNQLPHPYYDKKSGNNDIALLQVGEKINYTEFVRPICLPPAEFPPPAGGTRMEITGWGITENGSQSDVKLKVGIPMVSNPKCAKAFPDVSRIGPNQACAGGEEGKDACNGDSGGPLMRNYKKQDPTADEQWFQEGIIYRGLGCGLKGIPGLYTRVSRYTQWIIHNMQSP